MTVQLGDITLSELDFFAELGRAGSLRAAARQRGLEPSQASKTLQRLERKLGCSLLRRSPTGSVLTPEGARLLEVARGILTSAQALAEPGAAEDTVPQLLSIGTVRFLSTGLLAPRITELEKGLPHHRFRFLDFTPDQVVPAGMKGAFEVGITIGETEWTRAWDTKRLGDLSWGLFARFGHPLAEQPREAKEVVKYPFIAPNYWQGDGFDIGNDHCPLPWSERRPGHETSSAHAALEMVRHCDELVFAPRLLALPYLERRELQQIVVSDWRPVRRPLYLTVKAGAVSNRTRSALVSILGDALR